MKAIKYLIWIFLLLVIVAVGAVFVVTNLVDPNDYKPKIAELVKKQTGRDISLDGELSLTFFPWVGVETGKVSLSNAAGFGDAPMVAIDNARAQVKLLPLLKKQIEVDTVVLEKPVIRLSAREDGTTNWDDLLSVSSSASGDTDQGTGDDAAQGAGAIAGLAIQGVSIDDGFVEWSDGRSGQNLTLKQLNLTTGTLVPGKPLDIAFSVNAEGNMLPEPAAVAIDTTVTLDDAFTNAALDKTALSVTMQTIAANLDLDKAAYGLESGVASIAGLAANVDFRGVESSLKASSIDFDSKEETISIPDLNLSQGEASLTASVNGSGILSAPNASARVQLNAADLNGLLEKNGLSIPQLTQTLKDVAVSSDIVFANNQLDMSAVSLAAEVNSLPTTVNASAISVNLQTLEIGATGVDVKQTDFSVAVDEIDIPASQGEASAQGAALPLVSGNIALDLADIPTLLSRNGIEVDLPEIPVSNVSLNATAKTTEQTMVFTDLKLDLDHQGQPTSLVIPAAKFSPSNGAIDLEKVEIVQDDSSLIANVAGSGVTGELAAMKLKGNLVASVPAVADLLKRNAIPAELPAGVINSVSINSAFALSDNSLSISELDAKVDDMTVKGNLGLTSLDNPGYRFDLAINKLDLDRLLAAMESGEAEAGGAAAEEKPSTGEQLLLPVAPLRGLNVDGKASIGQFVTTGITLDDVKIVVKSDKNVLRIVPVTARLFGGSMETQLTYDVSADAPAVKTVNKIDSVDIGALLQALEVTDKIDGTGNLSTNLTASGADVDKMIASLAGNIDFNLLNGAIKGYDLQATLIDLEKQVNSFKGKETTDRGTPAAETKFAELSGGLVAKNGVFTNNNLSMKAPLFRLGGEGVIDLPKDRLDYKLDINVVESVEGQGGASLKDLKGARIPFKIYGPLASPSYTLDLASLLKERAKQEVKKEVKKKLLEKLSPDLAEELGLTTGSSAGGGEGAASQTQQATKNAAPTEPAAEPVPEDPKEALEQQLKKKLKKSLLKGFGLGG